MMALALTSLGHRVTSAADGPSAIQQLDSGVDVVVLDVMMPAMDGFECCRRLRAVSTVAIVMLTARDDPFDIVAGLECGADDYVTKPVEPRVLDARIKAVLRRSTAQSASRPGSALLRVGPLVLDQGALVASRSGVQLELSATELKLLVEFMRHPGQVLTRPVLLERVWDYGYEGDSRLVDTAIQRLRQKVEVDPSQPRLITTVRGFGYRLEKDAR